jgi:hypothetical protein
LGRFTLMKKVVKIVVALGALASSVLAGAAGFSIG